MERARILVVDGDEALLGRWARMLSATYDVTCTASLEQGQAQLDGGTVAVVVAGDHLPWQGGLALLQHACEVSPSTARVLLSARRRPDQLVEAINTARVHGYIERTWPADAIAASLAHEVELWNAQRTLQREHTERAHMVHDAAAGLACRAALMESAANALRRAGTLAVLCIEASPLWDQQTRLSPRDFEALRAQLYAALQDLPSRSLRPTDRVCVDEPGACRFFVFLAPPRDDHVPCEADIVAIAERLEAHLSRVIGSLGIPRLRGRPVRVASGFCLYDPCADASYQTQRICDASRRRAGDAAAKPEWPAHVHQLRRILDERCVRTLFQPISALQTGAVMGYEALSRGPAGGPFESPEFLLNVADEAGLTFELDRLFRSMALTNAVELPRDKYVFINTLTSTAHDPDLAAVRLERFLRQLDIAPGRVVFEFSERCHIGNHDLWVETLQHYRSIGVKLAIDDVGAGYSGLERIVAVRPDFIKIDRSLVQDVHVLPVKRSVLQALIGLADTLDAQVVAEGIEHDADRDCLLGLGVAFGQGHLIGRPAHSSPRAWPSMLQAFSGPA